MFRHDVYILFLELGTATSGHVMLLLLKCCNMWLKRGVGFRHEPKRLISLSRMRGCRVSLCGAPPVRGGRLLVGRLARDISVSYAREYCHNAPYLVMQVQTCALLQGLGGCAKSTCASSAQAFPPSSLPSFLRPTACEASCNAPVRRVSETRNDRKLCVQNLWPTLCTPERSGAKVNHRHGSSTPPGSDHT